jgi:outer membrane protein assembly factor BamB
MLNPEWQQNQRESTQYSGLRKVFMRFLLAILMGLFATQAFAVAPQFWRVRTAEDFLAGDVEGFTVTSRGELRPGPTLRKLATFSDPFVLAQTAAPNGDRYFGTGNDGKVYRLRGTDLKLIYTAPEPEVYSVAFHDGALYAGTSPNGKIYRIDPESGKGTVFFEPKQAYIWSLHFMAGGDLAVATGVEGKLFRVTPKGEGKVWYDAPDTHLRSIAERKDGSLLVGGSGKGRIYEVRADGSARGLFESPLSEISTIYVDAGGIGWAAGVSNVLPTSAPAPKQKPAQPTGTTASTGAGGSSSSEAKKEENPGANVEVTFSFDDATGNTVAQSGSSELYRIHPDGFVETVRKFEREMIYAISEGPNGSILLSTGPQGRIYQFSKGETSLIADLPEKQVVSISTVPTSGNSTETLIITTNSGAVYRMDNTPSAKAEFRSAAKDVERFSRFGHYRIEGTDIGDGRLAIAFRSGNTRTPDSTWSAWSLPRSATEGAIDAPAGRHIQWKLTMPKPAADLAVDTVTIAFVNRNMPPVIDSVTVAEPAVVYITGSYPPSPQVVEATNPDDYGIFTSLDSPRDKNEQGKKVFRKGFRTILWRAHDENGDGLRYSVAFRRVGSERWLRLRDNLEETAMNFDTSQLPDGRYELRITATDANDNPDMPMTDTKEGVELQVDNTPPSITVSSEGEDVVVRVTDKASPIGKVEYSVDAQKWTRLTPTDGLNDSSDESYHIKRSTIAGKFVVIRAVDAFFNVATESVKE